MMSHEDGIWSGAGERSIREVDAVNESLVGDRRREWSSKEQAATSGKHCRKDGRRLLVFLQISSAVILRFNQFGSLFW